jgi:hypothetical protein
MELDNISFAGFVKDPVEIWRNEHCLILPSRAEGLPLAIVEAMLCGRPCVVSDASGNPELMEDDVTGFISKGSTVTGMDEAMERAWQARDRWVEIGAAAAAAVRRAVPPNPAGVFACNLLEIAKSPMTAAPSEEALARQIASGSRPLLWYVKTLIGAGIAKANRRLSGHPLQLKRLPSAGTDRPFGSDPREGSVAIEKTSDGVS